MSPRLSTGLAWSAIALLALAVLPLLLRNALAVPLHVPLDPNEGWNAAHALAAMMGRKLYPPPQALMVNNYPPLSFYLVGAFARVMGDPILAGRALALIAFLLTGAGIAAVLRAMGAPPRGILLAVLFFSAALLIDSDYVGMDDPQLLGHAVQLGALLLALRQRLLPAAFLFAASLFIKHNLLALPLACALWLLLQDRRAGMKFILSGAAFSLAGLIAFRLAYGTSLLAQLASPRLSSLANLENAMAHLWWTPLPAIALAAIGPYSLFCRLYAGLALALGLFFAAGDGVDINVFFDLAIALSVALGLSRWPTLAAASALPLLASLALNFQDNNFAFTRDFARQSAADIAFLKNRPGPALCDQLSLCLWAGKGAKVDVFNIGEGIKAQARDPAALAQMIAARHFAVLQLEDRGELGPVLRTAIAGNYHLDHRDDNGDFLVPILKRAP